MSASDTTREYDLVVIGGGPAGIVGAVTAAGFGHSVAIVDSHAEPGGAGVNTGTVPSKTLRETALALSGLRSRNLYGVDLSLRREASVSDFLRHERHVKTGMNSMLSHRLASSQAGYFHGAASFIDPHTIRLTQDGADAGTTLRAGIVLIATGSSPVRPPLFPFDRPGVYDSDTILELKTLPKTMAVVGAGVIGSEYASTFAALGTQVHVIDGRNVLLPFLDGEVSRALVAGMERTGVEFHWNQVVQTCAPNEAGAFILNFSSGESLTVDAVLVAAGRRSNTASLNLSAAGIRTNDRGLILVDEHYRTETPHIYAAGDVIGFPALASTSMQQARLAMRHALGPDGAAPFSRLLPTGVYTIPEVGMAGETEETLAQQGVEYVVGRGPYHASARGRIIGDSDGFLKLIYRRDDMKLLGVHAIGEQATEVVHIGMIAMLTNSAVDLFEGACFNVPTLGELYKMASADARLRADTGRSLVDVFR